MALGASCGILGGSQRLLEASFEALGASWEHLAGLLESLGSLLGLLASSWGLLAAKRPSDHPKNKKTPIPLGPGACLRDPISEGFSIPFGLIFHLFLILS